MYFIGIDIGTSSTKMLLMNQDGAIQKVIHRSYSTHFPQPGWSEQNPDSWWNAVCQGMPELLEDVDASQVKGIGCCGQMHGLVVLDRDGEVIRPAIMWNDSRTRFQVDYLNRVIGRQKLARHTGNVAYAGFTAPKLLWLHEEEPENFGRIDSMMLPKDYITYKLTGEFVSDFSDASGTLLLNVEKRRWSQTMLKLCGLHPDQAPELYESYDPVGQIKPDVADELGLPHDVVVCAGASDNAAAAVGTGAVGPGHCNIVMGTAGTILIPTRGFKTDPDHQLHAFCSADGGWNLMGCVLSAAGCGQWWLGNIVGTWDYDTEVGRIHEDRLGENTVYFLPYLMGERTPHNDPRARGTFVGMRMDTSRADMTQAVLEGAAFALRDCLQVARTEGVDVHASTICGGAARCGLWKTILADVLGIPLSDTQTEQAPALGAAMLASVACGVYPSVAECAGAVVQRKDTVYPDRRIMTAYQGHYFVWHQIYPALKGIYQQML